MLHFNNHSGSAIVSSQPLIYKITNEIFDETLYYDIFYTLFYMLSIHSALLGV